MHAEQIYDDWTVASFIHNVPKSAWWTASLVAGLSVQCWPCWWDGNVADSCDHDPWLSPRPRLERAER